MCKALCPLPLRLRTAPSVQPEPAVPGQGERRVPCWRLWGLRINGPGFGENEGNRETPKGVLAAPALTHRTPAPAGPGRGPHPTFPYSKLGPEVEV